ncbi:MAG: hypothetical protein WCV85_01215 [Patescibacteria group bacterium]|jgi:hypothetical protein
MEEHRSLSLLLGGVLILVNLTAIGFYFYQDRRGGITPNPAAWAIWFVVTVVNLLTYQTGTHDWVKAINSVVSTFNCTLMFSYCLWKGRMRQVTKRDKIAICIAVGAILCWVFSGNAWYGNVFIQMAIAISFFTMVSSVWGGKHTERPLPWVLWTVCHALTFCIVLLRWDGQFLALLYPGLGVLFNSIATLVIFIKKPKNALTQTASL